MKAQLGRNPSYAWWSIWTTRDILERGIRWIVGNGRTVNVCEDKWLPIAISFKVCSPRRQGVDVARVDLMDCRKGKWDMEKVNNIFLPHEAKVILSIPISPSLSEDSLVWAWTNNGSFTVWSAYGVALQALKEGQQNSDKGTSSDNSKMTNIWKSIWQLKCPNKIKHFFVEGLQKYSAHKPLPSQKENRDNGWLRVLWWKRNIRSYPMELLDGYWGVEGIRY